MKLSSFVTSAAILIAGASGVPGPASAIDFPEKGRTVDMIVPFGAGGPTDVAARLLVAPLEKELGTSITVINKPGASTQIGVTQLVQSKPNGYTIGFVSLPQLITAYMDPTRKAAFSRHDLQPLAMHVVDPIAVVVRASSPYNSLKDLIEDAKTRPGKVKGGTGGFMGTPYLAFLELERITGAKLALVNFEGSAPGVTALLGGHIDVQMDTVAGAFRRVKSGDFRVLAIADSEESPFLPGVKTFAAQGIDMQMAASRGLALPAGTPKDIVTVWAKALEKTIKSEDHRKRMSEMGQTLRYLGPDQFAAYWEALEKQVQPLIENARKSVTTK